MKSRKIIAKRNLKKSIYLGGGMAAFTAAVGLAVSIPVYNKIQEELAKTTSKLKDLSGMMSQLTDKLGIPEGASFQKELAGGYEVVFENGQTKIYKNNGESKSLIINMNGDGTVGSAAQMQGPAAQTMLGVIQNAKESMEDDKDAMDDIIGPFANQAEDTSLATESAITGESVAALAKRNQLSAGENKDAQAAAQKRLDDLVARNKAIDAAALKAAETRAGELKAAAEKAKEEADKLAAAKRAGDAAKLQKIQDDQANASAQVLKDFIATLDYKNPPSAPTAVTADAPGPLSDQEIIELSDKVSGWGKAANLNVPAATDPINEHKQFLDDLSAFLQTKVDAAQDNETKNELKEYYQAQKIAAADAKLQIIKDRLAAEIAKAKLEATQKTTDHQMDHASREGHVTPAIVKLAKSLPNAINALMAAKYGYIKKVGDVDTYKNPSASVEKLIRQAMTDQGVSASTQKAIDEKIITPLFEATKRKVDGHDVQGTITFSEVVNTFALKETAVSRLLVLKASYSTGSVSTNDLVDHEQLFLANQTTKSPIDFESEGNVLQTVKTDITYDSDSNPIYSNSIYTAANYLVEAVNRDINPSITRDAAVALKDVVKKGVAGALKGIKDPATFNQLVLIAKAIDPINRPIQEKALVEILLSLAKKYLFEGKDVKIKGQEIIDTVDEVFKYDGTKEPTLTLDATDQDTPIEYGSLMKMIIKKINDPAFTDYSNFTDGAKPTLAFVNPKMVTIDEVEAMMDDSDLKTQIQSFEDIEKTAEGKRLVEADWKLVFDIMRSNQADHAIKILQNQDLSTITMNMEYLKSVLAKSLLPNDASTSAVYASLERLTTIWGYKGKTGLSDEEKAFRDKIIDEELTSSDIQEQLPAGDITFDAISKAFEILGKFGYIKSDTNADDAKVAIFNSFMNKETDTKEFALSTIVSLEKYYKGTVADEYINDVINKVLTDENFAKDADTAKNIDRLFTNWGADTKSGLSDEELDFRNFVIEDEIKNDKVQDPLTAGEISSADIKTAFKVLASNGYIGSDAAAEADNVKTYTAFASRSTTTKEQVLSLIASLDKYSTGYMELNDGKYIEYIINRILEDEDFASFYSGYAINHIDATSALLDEAKADAHYDMSFAFDMKDFILEKLDVNKEVIKSIKELSEYIDQFEDKDGTPETEIVEFKDNLYKHLYDGSASMEIDKVTKYIKHMIDRSNTGRLPNTDYNSLPDKEGTMRQIKMYGDKFFGTNTPIAKTEGDSAQSSLAQVIALEAKAGTPAAKARLALISKFPTIADAWQSGIVDAKPIVDPAYADQADQAIPTKIKSIGYNPEKNTFYMIGTLNGAASIATPSGPDLDKDHSRHKKDGSKIIYDQNKPYSLFVFEAKLVEKDGVFTLQYHRVQSMDFVIETDYDQGRPKSKTAGFTWESDHPMSTASVSTFNSEDNSFIAYGSGGSYANGHSKIWFDGTNWQHKYVDWGKGTYTSVGGAIAGSPSTAGAVVDGHSIGNSWHIGMSTIVDHKLYATEDERSNWYEIAENGATNSLMFSSVPTGYYKINPANDKQRLNIPKPNMIASIVNPIDESTGVAQSGTKLAVFINSFGSKQLMSLDLVHHSMSDMQLWETDSTGHLVKSTQSFDGSQAITTTASGNIYISAGHPVTPAKPEVTHKDAVAEVKDADGKVTTKGSAEVAHKDAEAEKPGTQQIYRVYLSDGKWQIEKVGNVIEGLRQPITSIYHYTQGKVDEKGNKVLDEHGKQVQEEYIVAISLDGVKVIKDIFAQ